MVAGAGYLPALPQPVGPFQLHVVSGRDPAGRSVRNQIRSDLNISTLFIRRPVATLLLLIAVALTGAVAGLRLPVAALPQADVPVISILAQVPGASPETMATTVATPLERHLSQIADVSEMTSTSTLGATRINVAFGLDRKIDGAARDVQAAINAARTDLPASLLMNPTYRKVNPADAPIMILALTSSSLGRAQVYDIAASVLQEKLSSLPGVGQVVVTGSSPPAVRVELNPDVMFRYGIGLEDVRAALSAANANSPKGGIEAGSRRFQIYTNDQARRAEDYRNLVVSYRNGGGVRLSDLAEVEDDVENLRARAIANGRPAVLLLVHRAPGANIIDTVERVSAALPQLRASIPAAIELSIASDQTVSIRASLVEVERALLLAIGLVILVVLAFLRSPRAALIPAVAVPVSLLGTLAVMYVLGYGLDNLSLMALAVATGFVVDDAIVVLENIVRHADDGVPRMQAARQGVREVGFTVLSMSLALIGVFLPILAMGGIVGRFFREFSVTLAIAVLLSLIISLTATPMLCALVGSHGADQRRGGDHAGRLFGWMLRLYEHSLRAVLQHPGITLAIFGSAICLNIYLYVVVPKGFLPTQDTGRLQGTIIGDQAISFQAMSEKLGEIESIVRADPDVAGVVAYIGAEGRTNAGVIFINLKRASERTGPTAEIEFRLRRSLSQVSGVLVPLTMQQDFRAGARAGGGMYQYSLQASDLAELRAWTPRITEALSRDPTFLEPNSDQQEGGLETNLVIDRATAARLGISPIQIDSTLYDAFGQRQVSTIFNPINQYHVVMEVAPQYWQSPKALEHIFVSTSGGAASGVQQSGSPSGTVASVTSAPIKPGTAADDPARNFATNALANKARGPVSTGAAVSTNAEIMIPLSAIAEFRTAAAPLTVNHQGLSVASTISFSLAPGVALSHAVEVIERTMAELQVPVSIRGGFAGVAKIFQDSLASQSMLIIAALATIYIVLGMLYESFLHPLTILSTFPSAGVGAVLGLLVTRTELTIVSMIGIILLIGIVMKNAIMMIDFALDAQRRHGLAPEKAILKAGLLRFRPIMMTTLAALAGALPLALGHGDGAEMRQPLGISIIGGLLASQALTLYTTPVIYLQLDRLRLRRGISFRTETMS
jgi:multidrug efflux pump